MEFERYLRTFFAIFGTIFCYFLAQSDWPYKRGNTAKLPRSFHYSSIYTKQAHDKTILHLTKVLCTLE